MPVLVLLNSYERNKRKDVKVKVLYPTNNYRNGNRMNFFVDTEKLDNVTGILMGFTFKVLLKRNFRM